MGKKGVRCFNGGASLSGKRNTSTGAEVEQEARSTEVKAGGKEKTQENEATT